MSEQFTLEQGFGECGTIYRDQRLSGPGAAAMDRAGNQLLTRSSFSGDENRGVGRRDPRDFCAQFPDRSAAPGYLRRPFQAYDRIAKPAVLANQTSVFHRALGGGEQHFRNEGLQAPPVLALQPQKRSPSSV